MKNLSILLFLAFAWLISSCDPSAEPDYDKIVEQTIINPAFEQSPPLATDISLELLEKPLDSGKNIRLVASFEQGQIDGDFLALNLNDEKVVLRDDGKGADEEKGDNKFSIFLEEDLANLRNELDQRKRLSLASDTIPIFKNRSMVNFSPEELEGFNPKELSLGRSFKIPAGILLGLPGFSDQEKTLMITDLDVVEDPSRTFNPCTQTGAANGVWTFGELMRQMASPSPGAIASDLDASNFARNWLNSWLINQTVNGESLAARPAIQNIISNWESKSNVSTGGILKMEFAPFKLIAIVNRLDLRGNSGYGFSDAGEGRLVFNALDGNCNALQFTVIFEYGINKRSCNAVKAFAQEWDDLNNLTLGSAAYNTALENITAQFTKCGTNPNKPNQNSINQVRTNEVNLGIPWELREFNLNNAGQLKLVTVKQEPAVKYNAKVNNADVERLATFVNNNTTSFENNNYSISETVPLNSGSATPTTPFLGGKSHTPFPPTGPAPSAHHWDGTTTPGPGFINSDLARHMLSVNTCSGCHGGETQTFFTHLSPSNIGSPTILSGFLTGITVSDAANRPAGSPTNRTFNDLLRRETDLNNLLSNTCLPSKVFNLAHRLQFRPNRMTH